MPDPEPAVYVVDDDDAVRRAIAGAGRLLGRPVRAFGSAAEFLAAYDGGPGCLVLDLRMPGMTGGELQQKLRADGLGIPVVVVSGHADVRTAVDVMARGAVTLLEKPFRLDELLAHLRDALDRDADARARAARRAAVSDRLAALTPKEREVLEAVAAGRTNREIADQLGLSLRAVEDRRARLMRKLDARTVADLLPYVARPEATD
jgi:RNA polymerase sigma factor (sigma-70 family)